METGRPNRGQTSMCRMGRPVLLESAMKTLFVISLPRSLSTLVYHVARLSLSLNEPTWTTDGEILNIDRYILNNDKRDNCSIKFTRFEKEPERFNRLSDFLSQVTIPQGFIYKDVVHPFVVSHWLKSADLNVLKIKRPLPDVAYAMMAKQWFYPAAAVDENENIEEAVIQGLIMAEHAIDRIPGETIDYDLLVQDELIVTRALEHLYPNEHVVPMGFNDEEFRQESKAVLERRNTDLYQKIEEKISLQKSKYFQETGE